MRISLAGLFLLAANALASPAYSQSTLTLYSDTDPVTRGDNITFVVRIDFTASESVNPGDAVTITMPANTTLVSYSGNGKFNSCSGPAAGTSAAVVVCDTTFSSGLSNVSQFLHVVVNSTLDASPTRVFTATFKALNGSGSVGIVDAVTPPTNSQIIDQMRQAFSRVAAGTSAQAMGDAASGAIGGAFSGNAGPVFSDGRFSFSSAIFDNAGQRSTARGAMDALGYASAGANTPIGKAPPQAMHSPWYVWGEGRFTGFSDHSITSESRQINATGGISYRFTDNFVGGLLVGYEDFRFGMNSAGGVASLKGEGVSGGGYFGWKFWDRLRLDVMAAYGRIDYRAEAGGVSGGFGANRITAMSRLSGRYGTGWGYVEPSSAVTFASERQDGFVDSAAVAHSNYSFSTGRSSSGASIGIPGSVANWTVTPSAGVFADYRFGSQSNLAALSSVPTVDNGWSAHVTGGLSFATIGGFTASLGGEYGGIGQGFRYWRTNAMIGVRF